MDPSVNGRARPPHPSTLSELLRLRLREPASGGEVGAHERQGRRFAVMANDELWAEVARQAVHLRRSGVQVGDRLLLAFGAPSAAWTAYLSAVCAGALPAIAPYRPALDGPARAHQRLADARRALGEDARLYGPPPTADGPDVDLTPLPAGLRGPRPTVDDLAALLPTVGPADPLHIQFSSGSTEQPKAVVVTHGSLMANATTYVDTIGAGPDDRFVSWLPLYHDLGLVGGCLTSLVAGASLYLLTPCLLYTSPSPRDS